VKNLLVVASLAVLGAAGPASAQPPAPIYFRDACAAGERVTVAAVGDLLFHFNLQQQALAKGGSFARFWEQVAPILRRADLVYGNFEGPAARAVTPGGRELVKAAKAAKAEAKPRPKSETSPEAKTEDRTYDRRFYAGGENMVLVFNFHPSAVAAVKTGGFTIVSTANNHAADRGSVGIDRTIDALEAAGLAFTGTRRRGETRPWSTLTRANGFTIAWLACTFSTNGMPDPYAQVLTCFGPKGEPRPEVLDEIRKLAVRADIDAVFLTPHWGVEYQLQPDAQQRRLAHEAIEAGATAVFGAHPHVLEPWEHYVAADGREGLIVYSSGNFISGQVRSETRSGLISLVELIRGADRKTRITAAGYVPTWVEFGSPWRVLENTGAASAAGLALTTRLLPPANRLHSGALDPLPKACGVAIAKAAISAEAPPADTTGAIAPPVARPIRLSAAVPPSHPVRRPHVVAPAVTPVDPRQ
jgi:poly-gamma-glutamate synthesis protein (capsule biosynthesis protein)